MLGFAIVDRQHDDECGANVRIMREELASPSLADFPAEFEARVKEGQVA
ncbi:hypothetical protein O4328_36850 [Rhodococcus opacus]|uniref:Uncharacterized protein n=1 Tax=Rhodococcus opacus TaxID=37919 RepID=A0ABT4NP47_RHOOP|nr:hypothetical protein [Rhodococcus opacus]MCZ4589158.1 hypothetical protein [Rhodococcus opacus]